MACARYSRSADAWDGYKFKSLFTENLLLCHTSKFTFVPSSYTQTVWPQWCTAHQFKYVEWIYDI